MQPAKKPNLGRLEKVDVTQYWQSAAADFAPWLCLEENIQLLGEAIGLSIEVVLNAEQMADYRADLLCREVGTKNWILIGSQLRPTDEQQFGQWLTECAGLDGAAIIWIASQFAPEHLKLLNWLNQHAQPTLRFWGVEIELWQIGKAAMAAQFNLVSSTDGAGLSTDRVVEDSQAQPVEQIPENQLPDASVDPLPESEPEPLTVEQEQNSAFWTDLCNQLEQQGSVVKAVTPPVGEHIDFAIGRAGFILSARLDRDRSCLAIELRLLDEDAQAHYGLLMAQKDWIESEMGFPLSWEEQLPECLVYCTLLEVKLEALDQWPEYIDWLCGGLECFHLTFADFVQSLNADDYHAFPPSRASNVLSMPS